MSWYPHLTVATIVEKDSRFLCVEENDNSGLVINQPAGHVEKNETLIDAAVRETLEETQWQVEVTSILGNSLFTSPTNNTTYFRTTFIAKAIEFKGAQKLDSDIERVLWLTFDEILERKKRLRSPMVLEDLYRYKKGESYPLNLIHHF
ncbi:ADP-ribose pyrophosphatase YjhB, NUDIX family [Alteromonadaceae bacterium Bs31]|nr:ADP-ribose pyrophosphatase YjhB, NUDIX family [Alteromonadaceae bacterium Bs31]